jgi:hypothetical protein
VTNTGTTLWPSTGGAVVRLGTHWYTGAGGAVQWDGERTALPQDLAPGQSVTLQANVRAPGTPGSFRVDFDLVLEGTSWFSWQGTAAARTAVTVRELSYGARYEAAAIGTTTAWTLITVPVTLTNTGERPWSPPQTNLSYHIYDAANRAVVWDGLRTALPSAVQPGQTVTVQAQLRTPAAGGTYTVRWDMVEEGVAWFSWKGVPTGPQSFVVTAPSYGAVYDASRVPASLPPRVTSSVPVTVTNNSNFAFTSATSMFMSYHWYDASGRLILWDGKRTSLDLAPGQTATVLTDVIGPSTAGSYRIAFELVQEGLAWFSSRGIPPAARTVSVADSEYWASYTAPATAAGTAGQTITVPVTLTNTGTRTWSSSEVFISYHLYRSGAVYVWDGLRTALPGAVAPGQSVSVNASVKLPLTAGPYELRFDLVHEGLTWFSWRGVPMPSTALTAQ